MIAKMKRKIKYIAIHCTATSQDVKVDSIKRYWKENLGWKSPGYHILIDKNGIPYYFLDFNLPSNGVKGFNFESINIAYIGGVDDKTKPLDNRTNPQKATLLNCIHEVMLWAGGKLIIQGHKDFPNVKKDCPSFDAKKEYSWINL